MSRLLFALAGDPGSGKSESGRYLAAAHGFHDFTGSEYLISEAARRGLTLRERQDYGNFQRKLRASYGLTFMIDKLVTIDAERVCNVGIRNRLDVDAFVKARGVIISLYCPQDIRFARVAGKDTKYPANFEEFKQADVAERYDPDPLGQHTH